MRCLEGVYFEILKKILLACYLESIIKSGPWYADLDGDADVDAASVQRLQYAIPSARLPSTFDDHWTSFWVEYGVTLSTMTRFSHFSSCTISYVPVFC